MKEKIYNLTRAIYVMLSYGDMPNTPLTYEHEWGFIREDEKSREFSGLSPRTLEEI